MENKKLTKSTTDRKLFGVCGGLAQYFGLDSTIVRVGITFLTLFYGVGLIPYIVGALIMPNED